MPDDGDALGRRVLIIVHEEGGAPMTQIAREKVGILPHNGLLLQMLDQLKREMPTRLSKAKVTTISKPTASAAPAKKKAARADKKPVANKQSSAKKSASKKSTARKPSAGAK